MSIRPSAGIFFWIKTRAKGKYCPQSKILLHDMCLNQILQIKSDSPSPNHYDIEKAKSVLDYQPSFSFGGKYDKEKPSTTPGKYHTSFIYYYLWKTIDIWCIFMFEAPNQYEPQKCQLDHQPAFSFGLRPEQKVYLLFVFINVK